MEKINNMMTKFSGSTFVYFLPALFFVSPFLVMFPNPVTYVMAFSFLVAWIKWVELKKKEQSPL